MAVYKKYGTGKNKIKKTVLVCLLTVAAFFALAVALGAYLGSKAESPFRATVDNGVMTDSSPTAIQPPAERIVHGEYFAPDAIDSFAPSADDPFMYASTTLYAGGRPMYKTNTERTLGIDASALVAMPVGVKSTIGLFNVSSVYADDKERDILYAYEKAIFAEFSAAGFDAVAVFDKMDVENYKDIVNTAVDFGASTVCVPYSVFSSGLSDDFFTLAAEKNGLTVALIASGVSAEALNADIENYAFYFMKYNPRLVIDGGDEALLSVLGERSMLCYQFASPRIEKETVGEGEVPAENTKE